MFLGKSIDFTDRLDRSHGEILQPCVGGVPRRDGVVAVIPGFPRFAGPRMRRFEWAAFVQIGFSTEVTVFRCMHTFLVDLMIVYTMLHCWA